jgi:hypothetical protein
MKTIGQHIRFIEILRANLSLSLAGIYCLGSSELNPTLTLDRSAIKTLRTVDQAVGATCGMILADDNMEMLANKMTMDRDLHCSENKSEVQVE